MPRLRLIAFLLVLTAAGVGWPPRDAAPASHRGVVYRLVFPVDGEHRFSRDFGDPRSGHTHAGTDILADKLTPVVAAADGKVRYLANEKGGDCCAVFITHDDGWRSRYIHLNNDTPGTDDGKVVGIAPGIRKGTRVRAGQLLGWVGDSGNAENTVSHLHFELRRPDGTPVDAFPSLQAALANPVTSGTPRIAGPAIRPPTSSMRPEVRRPQPAPPVGSRPPVATRRDALEVAPDAEPGAESETTGVLGEGEVAGVELDEAGEIARAEPVTPFLPVPADDWPASYVSVEGVELAEVRQPERPTFSCFRFRSDDESSE